jgi:predicted small lipoprotein YifL
MRSRVVLLAVMTCGMLACGRGGPLEPPVDLVDTFPTAERRPATASFDVAATAIGGESHRAIATPGISRVTWQLHIPARAVLTTAIALKPEAWTEQGNGVLFRIGVAEGRTYEELFTRLVDPFHVVEDRRWIPVTVDLSAYGGFKWSLFYHPSRLTWRVIFNTNAGQPGTDDRTGDLPLWGQPIITQGSSR